MIEGNHVLFYFYFEDQIHVHSLLDHHHYFNGKQKKDDKIQYKLLEVHHETLLNQEERLQLI
jgi:hypothetical protein